MALGLSFAFDANKETPQDAQRRRAIAEAIMGRTMSPQNVGEGFGAIAQGIVANVQNQRAGAAEQAGRAGADATRAKLVSLLGGDAGGGGFGGGNATTTSSAPLNMDGNEVYTGFMSAVREGGVTNPYALAAIAATGKHESSFRPDLATSTWSDPSESGQPGTAGGIMSWRGPRYDALTQFGGGDLSPATQAQFFLQENPELIAALNNAQSAEEAVSLMNNAWRFAGYNRPGGEAAARLATAQGFLPMFQQSPDADAYTQVASLDPTVGLDTLNAQNPATGLFDPGLATGQPAPAQAGNLPPQAPQQVAQAGNLPMQPQQQAPGSGVPVEFLMEALASPWVDDATKAVASQLLQQQLAPPPGPVTVGDVLVDPNTGQPIYDARNPSVTNVNGTVIDNRTGQPIYQAPQQRPYEIINGEVVFLDQQAGTAESAGQFGAPEPGWRGLTPEEKAAYGIPENSPAQINEGTGEVKGLGGVNVTTNVGDGMSPGWQAIDRGFADTYLSWVGGGSADVNAQLENLGNAIGLLESGQAATGTALSMLPREAQAFFNSDGIIARENVEEVVQRSLRETLGAQFTEREGERLIQRAFNPLLPTEENIRRVSILANKVREMAAAKDAMVEYFNQNGTLMGYQGPSPSMNSLLAVEAQFGADPDAEGARPGPGQSSANPGVVDFSDYFN